MTDAASPKTQRRALAVRSPRHKAMLSKSARQCGDGRGTALTWCDPDLCGRTNPDATPIFALYQTLGVATWRNRMGEWVVPIPLVEKSEAYRAAVLGVQSRSVMVQTHP